jgi:hypothetical protein
MDSLYCSSISGCGDILEPVAPILIILIGSIYSIAIMGVLYLAKGIIICILYL